MLLFTELQVNHIHFETAFYSFVRKKYCDFYRTTVKNSAIEHTQAIGEQSHGYQKRLKKDVPGSDFLFVPHGNGKTT